MKKTFIINALCAMLCFAITANAAGNAAAGKAKALQCIACHGIDGNSVIPQFPKLAGQHAEYLAELMKAYKAGTRFDQIMSPMADTLLGTDTDIEDMAAYFASQTSNACSSQPETDKIKAGKAKVKAKGCYECHQMDGNSEKPIFPKLAGQHEAYLIKSMKGYREGTRKDDYHIMSKMALFLSDDADIESIAAYFASQKSDTCQ